MKEVESLAIRLEEVLLDGTWVTGTNFRKEITSLDWKVATKKIANLHSIAEITFHVHYYIAGVLKVLDGGLLTIKDAYSFDAPPIVTDEDWKNRVRLFTSDAEKFIAAVTKLPLTKLSETFVDEKYGNYKRNINVLIEHSYYHLGQIILIKKLLSNEINI